ncbi:MAG: TetR/AcrR family transcriptional regulator [Bacteroidota bacterium]
MENSTTTKNKKEWILAGYAAFAQAGPGGLKVEALARAVQKSKSSFYHYFADLEIFTEQLLAYHSERAQMITIRESECQNVDPELLEVFVEFKQDLLFNRQLRVHREKPGFEACFQAVNAQVGLAILPIWSAFLGLPSNSPLASLVLTLTVENFFLQITADNLNMKWLQNYVQGLRQMVRQFQHSRV